MSEPATIEVRVADLRNLIEASKVCAADLSVEIAERYPQSLRDQYPTYQRSWINDMSAVSRLENCIERFSSIAEVLDWIHSSESTE